MTTGVIMALPRTGSAWLAAYFGYLHDPLIDHEWEEVRGYSIVDTGAAYNPEAAYRKYVAAGKRPVVLLRRADHIYESLHKAAAFPLVKRDTVSDWLDKLAWVAQEYDIPTVWYEDLNGRYSAMHGEELSEYFDEEFDHLRWNNQRHLNVQTDLSRYTPDAFERYRRWVDAP